MCWNKTRTIQLVTGTQVISGSVAEGLMSVYVVTWNINRERYNYSAAREAFIAQFNRYETASDPGLESVRFVSTTQTAHALSTVLQQQLDDNDRLLVSKMRSGEHQGWLAKTTWDWINARLTD